ncbi:MAG TPA: GDYXXLXY domain-containing protein [Vitreimonas sp.]|uniref:GDYXXLXY domain-containing protein n=1 Tax=Vitreimonas sp. TaxID=3069702 RepID=UPI002D41CE52|nr:GDYXXLXY domain-containing protein [Vitreimonas sp.]HYD88557.1 GDYXXLXY domain-containing protein [Vitreimonas sp.]
MKVNAGPRILLVAGACALSLIGLVVSEGLAREGGQEVLLPIEAVDPRSLLQGHYVLLNLTQRLEPGETCPAGGDLEWIALREENGVYVAVGGADSREQAQLLGLPVKGTFACQEPSPAAADVEAMPGWVRLDLGVDRFHINQTDALRIERVLSEQRVDEPARAHAIVSIGRDGRGRLRGLMVDGERLELDWL